MKIVCAASVYMGGEAFSTLGDTQVLADEKITRKELKEADVLVIRSKTRANEALLRDTRVSFVGTATAGIDHLDTPYLEATETAWCAASGCNANSVAEYLVASLLYLGQRHSLVLEDLTLGIVGVGHVGSKVVEKAEALGMTVLKNDPPRREAEGRTDFDPLEYVLRHADVVSLHVPLERGRPWPTVHMANYRFFEMLRPGCIFINTARGQVADPSALLDSLEQGVVSTAVIDVWEPEPNYPPALLSQVDLGTPHIAGYSLEGRFNGTWAVYHEVARFLEQEPTWRPSELSRGRGAVELALDAQGRADEEVLAEIVRQVYDVVVDDRSLRAGINMDDRERGEHFRQLRREYAMRREFQATSVTIRNATPTLERKIIGLGFQLDRD